MGLADILSTPFLISLGITFLLVGILGIFLSQKIMDQNHKISSMLGLVTTMAEELNFIRSRFQMNNNLVQSSVSGGQHVVNQVPKEDPLIEVSDDEEEDDDDEDDDDEDDYESEEEKLVIGEEDPSTIKVIQMGETMTFREQDDLEELEEVEESTFVTEEDNASLAEESVSEATVSDATVSVSEATVSEETVSVSEATVSVSEATVISEKSVSITSSEKKVSGANLKKMTIQNLRDIAVKKGFTGDVSKMKKADIIKIVEGLL
jgi:hypothetical protein